MAHNLLRLYHLADRPDYLRLAEVLLRLHTKAMIDQPFGMANMLGAADLYVDKPREIFVIGKRDAAGTRELLQHIAATYVPNRTLTVVEPGGEARSRRSFAARSNWMASDGYVCHRMTARCPSRHGTSSAVLLVACVCGRIR
jgi:uncharacterized protein YyaL (SSP411 family)